MEEEVSSFKIRRLLVAKKNCVMAMSMGVLLLLVFATGTLSGASDNDYDYEEARRNNAQRYYSIGDPFTLPTNCHGNLTLYNGNDHLRYCMYLFSEAAQI